MISKETEVFTRSKCPDCDSKEEIACCKRCGGAGYFHVWLTVEDFARKIAEDAKELEGEK